MPTTSTILVRDYTTIYQTHGQIANGSFQGRWHFSFDHYYDANFMNFGPLRVFNDDTLSPGAIWPLHPHHEIEVITYCASGEFRHEDENGLGGILRTGDVQHTTVGRGMWHSEINNLPDEPMRFVQMWFMPFESGLEPEVQQRGVEKDERTNRLLVLASNIAGEGLPLMSDARVFSCHLQTGHEIQYTLDAHRGVYLYVVDGGPIHLNGQPVSSLSAAMVSGERHLEVSAIKDAELLLVDVGLDDRS